MRVPIENKGKMPLYVAGVMIAPGEIRLFEEDLLPPEYRPGAAEPEAVVELDPLVDILAMTVAQVAAGLAALSAEELSRLELLELEGKNRKGVLEAIAAEGLTRAEKALLDAGAGSGDGAGGEGSGN